MFSDCQVVPYVLGDAFYENSPNKLEGYSFGKNFLVDLKAEFEKHGHADKTIAYLKVSITHGKSKFLKSNTLQGAVQICKFVAQKTYIIIYIKFMVRTDKGFCFF